MVLFKIGMENIPNNSGMTTFTVGIVIVFLTLAVLYLAFSYASKLINLDTKKVKRAKSGETDYMTASENAAIATALYLYMKEEQRVEESGIITIKKVVNKYAPWSSKYHTLRKLPNRKF